jgi:guanidinopropionase
MCGLRGLNLVGADVVEVSPPFAPSGNTALIAATILFEILCILAESINSNAKNMIHFFPLNL